MREVKEMKFNVEETCPTGFDALATAFGFINAVVAPLLNPADVDRLADALVKRAIEMTGERA